MAVQIGDIVDTSSNGKLERWVVDGFTDQHRVTIVRRYGSVFSHYTKDADKLAFVQRPIFQPGDPVVLDGNKAVFMSRDGNKARIMLAPQRWVIADYEIMDVQPAVAVLSYATLVLENGWKEPEGD
ncbi:hypothetical protein [Mesorhizobium sp. CA7]|uniref:hypothetical protein n=1 Tax=Mesorhizobium sp. CA7 TaxID=588501 RepID=UPI001CCB1906|nr:hypothetical protein [Mesorhizobium sp. CA7]MBZ9817281.1 hypothetical protein [Mesorhizobium sp. CA7]